MMQISIIGVPLLVIVYTNPAAKFFVWTGIIFIVSSTTLLLIFVPKVINSRKIAPTGKHANSDSMYGSETSCPPNVKRGSVQEIRDKIKRAAMNSETSSSSTEDDVDMMDKIQMLKDMVMEKHNVDISSEVMAVQVGVSPAAIETAEPIEKVKETAEGVEDYV